MLPSANHKIYKDVQVLILTWSQDTDAIANAKHLGDTFSHCYNFNVTYADERDFRLKTKEKREKSSKKAKKWFDAWFDRVSPNEIGDENEDILLILCYIGHGTIRDVTEHGWRREHFHAIDNRNADTAYDITQMQTLARDGCLSDVLCIFECCDGNYDGMDDLAGTIDGVAHLKTMETLAASADDCYITEIADIDHFNDDFTRRLSRHLRNYVGPFKVTDRFLKVRRQPWRDNPGVYRRDNGQTSIVLEPLRRMEE